MPLLYSRSSSPLNKPELRLVYLSLHVEAVVFTEVHCTGEQSQSAASFIAANRGASHVFHCSPREDDGLSISDRE